MKKFFKMQNLVKKIILILQNFFLKIVEIFKKKHLLGNIQNRLKLANLAKKNPIVVLIYILKKKMKFFGMDLGVIFTFWKEDLEKN